MPNQKRFTEEEESQVVSMYLNGHKAQDIADKVCAAQKTVLRVLKERGVSLRRRKERFVSAEKLQEMIAMYETGVSFQEVADRYKLSWKLVNRLLLDAGVQPRPAGFRRGEDHHAWVGGRHVSDDGYTRVWLTDDSPFYQMAQKHSPHGGYVLEHRLVMAQKLGRPLTKKETVHHIDGNTSNNSPENLQLRQGRHGKGTVLCCADCGSHNIVPANLAAH